MSPFNVLAKYAKTRVFCFFSDSTSNHSTKNKNAKSIFFFIPSHLKNFLLKMSATKKRKAGPDSTANGESDEKVPKVHLDKDISQKRSELNRLEEAKKRMEEIRLKAHWRNVLDLLKVKDTWDFKVEKSQNAYVRANLSVGPVSEAKPDELGSVGLWYPPMFVNFAAIRGFGQKAGFEKQKEQQGLKADETKNTFPLTLGVGAHDELGEAKRDELIKEQKEFIQAVFAVVDHIVALAWKKIDQFFVKPDDKIKINQIRKEAKEKVINDHEEPPVDYKGKKTVEDKFVILCEACPSEKEKYEQECVNIFRGYCHVMHPLEPVHDGVSIMTDEEFKTAMSKYNKSLENPTLNINKNVWKNSENGHEEDETKRNWTENEWKQIKRWTDPSTWTTDEVDKMESMRKAGKVFSPPLIKDGKGNPIPAMPLSEDRITQNYMVNMYASPPFYVSSSPSSKKLLSINLNMGSISIFRPGVPPAFERMTDEAFDEFGSEYVAPSQMKALGHIPEEQDHAMKSEEPTGEKMDTE